MFLLVSHRPGALLPTIRSRCLPIGLRGLSDDQVRQVLAETRPDVGAKDLDRAVALAGGRPRTGFEALLLGDAAQLMALRAWLADPLRARPAAGFALAEALGGDRDSAELRFAREMISDAVAAEARDAALAPGDRRRLASATELWDKARLLLADADEYNLDMRLTLTAIFDAIRQHKQLFTAPAP
jgi:DNA polymerase-3 subunit delta'